MLIVCTRCGRHAKPSEVCFFCGAALERRAPVSVRRASRAGAFAAAAAVGLACGARTELGAIGGDAAADVSAADVSAADVSAFDGPGVFYGGPFPDAGMIIDATAPPDADADATGIALYGAPPPED